MIWCDHCGHAFNISERDHLREMPELRKDAKAVVPLAIVCPSCDMVQRIVYSSSSASGRPGPARTPPQPSGC